MLALQLYEDGLCPGCSNPKHLAWELPGLDNDFWEASGEEAVRCIPCSLEQEDEVTYSFGAVDMRVVDAATT